MYTQYCFCTTQKECRLYDICKKMKERPFVPVPLRRYRYVNAVPLTYNEKREHNRKYHLYNYLFGDSKQKMHNYYIENREKILASKGVKHSHKIYKVQEGYCNFDCEHCEYEDCILPKWNDTSEYMKLWKKQHKEEIHKQSKVYYEEHKDEISLKRKKHRAKPEVKKARAEYDKKYREQNRDKEIAKQKRYYEKHKDEINAKKREKRKQEKIKSIVNILNNYIQLKIDNCQNVGE